jgi:putative ABC transport system permease protein
MFLKYGPLIWVALWRKPVEALLTWLAVIAAFTLFGLMNGLTAAVHNVIESGQTDVLFVEQKFFGSGRGLPIGLREQLLRMEGVTAVGAVYGLSGYHETPDRSTFIYLVDEGARAVSSDLPLSPEQWDRLLATPSGLFVSPKAAERWNLKVGDRYTVSTRAGERADGGPGWSFEVLGITPGEQQKFFNGILIGNFHYIDEAKPPGEQGIVDRFRVAVANPARADDLVPGIDRHFANSSTPTRSMTARFRAINDVTAQGGALTFRAPILAGAGLFMVLLLVANGIAQSVRERIPEFAVLRTLGFQDVRVMGLVFAEALIPCLAGAVLGTLLAAVLTHAPRGSLPDGLTGLPPPVVSPTELVIALAAAVLLALVSSVIPVLKLRRLSVVDALAGR